MTVAEKSPRQGTRRISDAEWQVRRDLAACYRLIALFGWDDLLATHISARIPGVTDAFLINPFGLLFEEVTASSLIALDGEGNKLDESPYGVNQAGFVVHSAVHQARHDAGCVMHLHTLDGVAVSALADGLEPLNQTAMLLTGEVAFHDYEGVAVNLDERARLAADLGQRNMMFLRNHGTLMVGATVAEAFYRAHVLETACAIQVRTLGMNRPLTRPSPAAIEATGAKGVGQAPDAGRSSYVHDLMWPALLRKLDRINPGYAD